MRRAIRPFNSEAIATADRAVFNLTKPPGRRLDPDSPEDAELRKKWMDSYQNAGGAVETVSSAKGPGGSAVGKCPKWIEIRYLHCDDNPVKNAKYHIRSEAFNADGDLDGNGFVRIDGVPDIGGFTYFFDSDPETYQPKGPSIPSADGKVEATSFLSEVGSWLWGTVQGDFNENQSTSQVIVNTILGLIPIVDQVLDVRDLIAGVTHLVGYYMEEEEEQRKHPDLLGLSYETWLWLGVFLIAIGCIPIVGSAVKGVLKTIIRFLQDALKKIGGLSAGEIRRLWEQVVKVLNHFGVSQGNAHRWLKELPGKLDGYMDDAAKRIQDALGSLRTKLDAVEAAARKIGGETGESVIRRVKQTREGIAKAYARLDEMKRRINAWIKEQLERVIGGKHPVESSGSTNVPSKTGGGNTHIQQKEPPPEVLTPEEVARKAKRFHLDEEKFKYFFGKVAPPDETLKATNPKKYEKLKHNYDRSQQLKKVFSDMGIEDNPEGRAKLMDLFDRGMDGPELATHTDSFGTTITRSVEQDGVILEVKYFYEGGDLTGTPKVVTVIPKVKK